MIDDHPDTGTTTSVSTCKSGTKLDEWQVTFSRYCPLTFGVRKASLGVGLCYSHIAFWGTWCIPIATYVVLPQLALINNRPLFPKVCFYPYIILILVRNF
jgi:hypothetical protein